MAERSRFEPAVDLDSHFCSMAPCVRIVKFYHLKSIAYNIKTAIHILRRY